MENNFTYDTTEKNKMLKNTAPRGGKFRYPQRLLEGMKEDADTGGIHHDVAWTGVYTTWSDPQTLVNL